MINRYGDGRYEDRLVTSRFYRESGAPGPTRTGDPLLRRQMLYPTELRARASAIGASLPAFGTIHHPCFFCRCKFYEQMNSCRSESIGGLESGYTFARDRRTSISNRPGVARNLAREGGRPPVLAARAGIRGISRTHTRQVLGGRSDQGVGVFVHGDVQVHGALGQFEAQQNGFAVQRSVGADVNFEKFRGDAL